MITYEPLKLSQTNRYPGYQFHARVRMDGMSAIDTFRYVILTIYKWIRSKVPEADQQAAELQVPAPEEYASVVEGTFAPFHLNIGFALDITPLVSDGIWALRLKEPDSGSAEREAVPGRMFTTRVGVRLNDKGYTELGLKLDVTDPASVGKEVPYSFRPGFVRTLAIQPSVVFEQVRELKYGSADRISTEDDWKRLQYFIDNEDNQLPLVVFTHHRPGEKKTPSVSVEEFMKNEPMKSLLQPSGLGFGMPGKKEMPMPDRSSVSGMPALRPGVVVTVEKKFVGTTGSAAAVPGAGPFVPDVSAPAAEPVLPYDADKFSRSAFAYALTFVLGDKYLDKLRSRVKKEFGSGDILVFGARKFRGGITVVPYPSDGEEKLKKAYDEALLQAQSYSKHKAPYDFGSVVFEAEARKLEQHARIREIVNSSAVEEKDKIAQLEYEMELLFNVIDDREEDIRELNAQKSEAYERGAEAVRVDLEKLKGDIADLRAELADRDALIEQIAAKGKRADEVLAAQGNTRSIDELPRDNKDIVRYFKLIYSDRLVFTERGEKEASRCGLNPDHLWRVLFTVANDLTEVYRNAKGPLTDEQIMCATGFDVALHEGSMTREQSDYMKLREDEIDGKKISVEPHLKLKQAKGEPAHQRLHFQYDPEMRRIVVGYLGDHLESAATKYVKKR